MDRSPLISIIVPIFNRADRLEKLLKSFQNQTHTNWELLLVDDASTDATKEISKDHAVKDKRIKVHSNTNTKGPAGARNTGLSHAQGKYIAYQDSDDDWIETHLEDSVIFLEKYPEKVDIVTSNPLRKFEDTGEVYNYDEVDLNSIEYERLENAFLINQIKQFDYQLRGRIITTQCIVGKSEILKSNPWPEDLQVAEDNLHNLRLAAKDIGILHIQSFHVNYWSHSDNLTNAAKKKTPAEREPGVKSFCDFWSKLNNEFQLTSEQSVYVQKNLSQYLAWHLAYSTLEPQKKYRDAFFIYLKAIKQDSKNMKLYRALIKVAFKAILK